MNRAPRKIEDYDALMNPIREKRLAMIGKQPGDPAKLGEAMVKLVNSGIAATSAPKPRARRKSAGPHMWPRCTRSC